MSKLWIDFGLNLGAPGWDGHRGRLRDRMERDGWDALKPHEMVELVLLHADPRQDVGDAARALVETFGSVGGVFAAPRERLCAVPGMTPAMAEWVALTGEALRAYLALMDDDAVRLSRWAEVRDFIAPLAQSAAPSTWALYVDFEFNLITFSRLETSPWWTAENARLMAQEAVSSGARYLILVRCFGDAPADIDDAELGQLRSVATALRALDVEILDCALAARDGVDSLNRSGRMDVIRQESQNLALHERYVGDE